MVIKKSRMKVSRSIGIRNEIVNRREMVIRIGWIWRVWLKSCNIEVLEGMFNIGDEK